ISCRQFSRAWRLRCRPGCPGSVRPNRLTGFRQPLRPMTGSRTQSMALAAFAKKFFGSANDRRVRRYQANVDAINALEAEYEKLSDDQLRAKTEDFKAQLAKGAKLADLIVP